MNGGQGGNGVLKVNVSAFRTLTFTQGDEHILGLCRDLALFHLCTLNYYLDIIPYKAKNLSLFKNLFYIYGYVAPISINGCIV